jgi:hypothetical protein
VDCVVSAWSVFTACDLSCGGGSQNRSRAITTAAAHNGTACPAALSEQQACNAGACPIDCVVSEWAVWGKCTKTCGGGYQKRQRFIATPPRHKGSADCPPLHQNRKCGAAGCPVDCVVGGWGALSDCSARCGAGARTRSRQAITTPHDGGAACPALAESTACDGAFCPVGCAVTGWSGWGQCSSGCGNGTEARTRTVGTAPLHGGAECPPLFELRACAATDGCPVDCVAGAFGNFSECGSACGAGTWRRTRSVEVPPSGGGASCGPLEEEEVRQGAQSAASKGA